jgi:AraC-like DNA-binding protein
MNSVTHTMSATDGGRIEHANIGSMKVGRFASDRACVIHHPVAIPSDATNYLFIAVQLKGCSVHEQYGRKMQLLPGSWGMCDAPKPCVSTHEAGVEQIHFLIPKDQIRLSIDTRFVVGRTFSGESTLSGLLCQTINALFEVLPTLNSRRAEELAEVVTRLFHLALHEKIEQPGILSPHDEMRERICTHVENRLRDPKLSLDGIASELNCTKRYLHMAFAGQVHTLSEYIWIRRLDRCRLDLANPAHQDRSITDIAMYWGFSNLSHFSRAFRERYGIAPRSARGMAGPVKA